MRSNDVFVDAYGRVRDLVGRAVKDLSPEQLQHRVDPEANTIAWLVWHLARIQDDHIAHVAGLEQVWTSGGWKDRFRLPFDDSATGFGHASEEVGQVRATADLLSGYYEAVHDQSIRYLGSLSDEDLDRVVDTRWDPPVTLGGRLVSVLSDNLQHAGQALFIRGITERGA